MTSTTVKNIPREGFIPLKQMEELFKMAPAIPYSVEFSLQPFIDKIKAQMCSACDNTKSALLPVLEGNQAFIEAHKESEDIIEDERFKTLLSMAVPSLMYSNELSYLAPPFTKKFIAKTNQFEEFINNPDWDVELKQKMTDQITIQAGICILNRMYGQDLPLLSGEIFTVRNRRTRLVKHFRMNLKTEFVNVEVNGKLPKLSQPQIDFLVQNPEDAELWLKSLPANKFSFKGFTVGNLYDVTDIQVFSDFKQWMGHSDTEDPIQCIDQLGYYIRSFLGVDDLKVGILMLDDAMDQHDESYSLTGDGCIRDLLTTEDTDNGIYDHMLTAQRVLYIEDIKKLERPSKAEKKLMSRDIRSFVMSPMKDENGNLTVLLELGSSIPGTFNNWSVNKLQDMFNYINISFEKFNHEINNQITAVIQKNFTSIHPSVAWKFEEVAKDYFVRKQQGEDEVTISPIVFPDVYPLYGQSDIVNSSSIRSRLIKQDLVENITLLKDLLENWSQRRKIHLLEAYRIKLQNLLVHLDEEFVSADESRIVSMITREIRPLLETAASRYPDFKDKMYNAYLSTIDPELGIIYNKRKDFEKSINRLNAAISEYLENEEHKMQSVLPHYFEKYKTDGVEYNMYLGESLLRGGKFFDDDLRNFKLWQLETTCELTRLVDRMSRELPVPLKTAELIFVYNHSLSIRFRMDEKKFDVDGAYNVRYEILKKRIDKATIKGSNERLTQAGKIAIVYLGESDKSEYLDFFEYLLDKGYIDENIEDLELNDVQGAEGLHALRITVKKEA